MINNKYLLKTSTLPYQPDKLILIELDYFRFIHISQILYIMLQIKKVDLDSCNWGNV